MLISRRTWIILAGTAVLWLFPGCPPTPPEEEQSQPYEWDIARSADQGLDSLQLARATERAEAIPGIGSLLVVRNGYLVWERYFDLYDMYIIWHTRSVTKSFISALVGIALAEGYLDSVGQRLFDLLPEYVTPGMDTAKGAITLEHLLTMTAGLEWRSNDDAFMEQWYFSYDWLEFAMEQPLVSVPGATFNYNSALPHLVSAILTRHTGMSTRAFANQFLFDPLGITVTRWDRAPEGVYMGGFGLFLAPRDMARFGQLYADGGVIDGERIVPMEWIEESTSKHVSLTGGLSSGYGYWWWKKPFGVENFVAIGADGQLIYVFPSLRMVVVMTAVLPSGSTMSSLDSVVKDYILSAVRAIPG